MSYSEIDVIEVLEGFPPHPKMSPASKREVVRRLDAISGNYAQPLYTAQVLAKLLQVNPRTITRYRQRNRQEQTDAIHAALGQLDGSPESAVALLTGVSPEQLDKLGGMSA